MVKVGRAAKHRITRNNQCPTRRKAGLIYEGQSINYDDIRIKKAFAYNFDLSNEFVVATPDKRLQKPTLEAIENKNSISVHKKKRKKQPSSKKKPPIKKENVEEVQQIQTMFGEIEDFELMTEVLPKIKDQYVIKRKRARLIDEKSEPKSKKLASPIANEIVNETKDIKMDLYNSIVEETEQIRMSSISHIATINEEIVDETENIKMDLRNSIVEETEEIKLPNRIPIIDELVNGKKEIEISKNISINNSVVEETQEIKLPKNNSIIDELVDETEDISRVHHYNSIIEETEQIQSHSSSHISTINEEIVDETENIKTYWHKSNNEIVEETEQIYVPSYIPIIDEEENGEPCCSHTLMTESTLEETKQIQFNSSHTSIINEEIIDETDDNNIIRHTEVFSEKEQFKVSDYNSINEEIADETEIHHNENVAGREQIKVSNSHISIINEDDKTEEDNKIHNNEIIAETDQVKVLLELCEMENVINWQEFASSTLFENCSKLGEGTYGEVFKISINGKECALKIIPFAVTAEECNKMVNGDYLKPPMSTYNELLITMELSKLSDEAQTPLNGFVTGGFIRLIQFAVVKGFYPEPLLDAWDSYKIKRPSLAENQRPTEYATEDQHFILFALSNGGIDLESFKIGKQKESYSIFYQIAYSLAIAEEALEFEHRDLHIGNVLIDKCDEHEIIRYIYDGEDINIKSSGVRVSIIDFTNSRIRKDELVVYIDLSEEEDIFKGKGEGEKDGDYQFDIYRLMRDENSNNWVEFKPKTNLLWLHYLSKKLFNLPKLFRKRRLQILEMFNKLLNVERVRDFLNDEQFLKEFAEYRA